MVSWKQNIVQINKKKKVVEKDSYLAYDWPTLWNWLSYDSWPTLWNFTESEDWLY